MATKEEVRESILQAAQGLFARFGPIKTSVADIARELGMSPANIYNFFPSRDAILEAVGERHLATVRQRVEREIARIPDPWRKIETMFLITARSIRDHLQNEKDILQLQAITRRNKWQFVESYHAFTLQTIQRLLQEGIDKGRFRRDKTPLRGMGVEAMARAVFDSMAVCHDPHLLLMLAPAEHEVRAKAQLKLLEAAFS